jgi:hypothetical protein
MVFIWTLTSLGIQFPPQWGFRNLLPLARMLWKPSNRGYQSPFISRSQPFLATLLFPNESFQFHDAGDDARATFLFYEWITDLVKDAQASPASQDFDYAFKEEEGFEDEDGFIFDEGANEE